MLREFGDGQEIEAAGGEKCGVDGAAEPLEGSANHGETVLRAVSEVAPSLISETNLETKVGHSGLDSGGRGEKSEIVTLRRCDARVK